MCLDKHLYWHLDGGHFMPQFLCYWPCEAVVSELCWILSGTWDRQQRQTWTVNPEFGTSVLQSVTLLTDRWCNDAKAQLMITDYHIFIPIQVRYHRANEDSNEFQILCAMVASNGQPKLNWSHGNRHREQPVEYGLVVSMPVLEQQAVPGEQVKRCGCISIHTPKFSYRHSLHARSWIMTKHRIGVTRCFRMTLSKDRCGRNRTCLIFSILSLSRQKYWHKLAQLISVSVSKPAPFLSTPPSSAICSLLTQSRRCPSHLPHFSTSSSSPSPSSLSHLIPSSFQSALHNNFIHLIVTSSSTCNIVLYQLLRYLAGPPQLRPLVLRPFTKMQLLCYLRWTRRSYLIHTLWSSRSM